MTDNNLNPEFVQIKDSNYAVNRLGQVKNLKTENILQTFLISDYPAVNIYMDKKRKTVYVHHLVALIFLDYEAKRGLQSINHIDQNKENNRLDNLEIISHRRNTALAYEGRRDLPTGVCRNQAGRRRYKAQINYMGIPRYLGSFFTPEEAHEAYKAASDLIEKENRLPEKIRIKKKNEQ